MRDNSGQWVQGFCFISYVGSEKIHQKKQHQDAEKLPTTLKARVKFSPSESEALADEFRP